MFTERYSVFKLLLGSGLLSPWPRVHVRVLVLQELFAVQSSSGYTDSSVEHLSTLTFRYVIRPSGANNRSNAFFYRQKCDEKEKSKNHCFLHLGEL